MDNKKRKIVFEPSGKRVGDYQLGQRLGAGGMGAVYLARQISMKRLVALKILHSNLVVNETSLQRFFREMRLSANVTGEGFARVYEAGREGSIVYFPWNLWKAGICTVFCVCSGIRLRKMKHWSWLYSFLKP